MKSSLPLMAIMVVGAVALTGCGSDSGGDSSGSSSGSGSGGNTGGSSGGGTPDYSSSFITNESGEDYFSLSDTNPNHLDVNNTITLKQAATVMAFTSAEYSVLAYALDSTNAQLFLNGSAFQGYLLNATNGGTGFYPVNVPAGTYYIGVVPGQGSIPAGYANHGFDEISTISLPNWHTAGNVPLAAGGQPLSWKAASFTIGSSASREYIETEGTGTWMVMADNQYQSFKSTYSTTYGGQYSYVYACGGQNGGAASEIECELQLTPGAYWMVWVNDTSGWAGGAGNVLFFAPN
ncbi:MAG TPA: hypothetical protein VFL15_01460 [Gammaproteobacteria bacterium]|nr:hypothetical protein [Gammaproteobacteria bacterium]